MIVADMHPPPCSPMWRRAAAWWESELEPLWPGGLAVAVVIAERFAAWLLHWEGKRTNWALYIAMGTIFPALTCALSIQWQPRLRAVARAIRGSCVLILLSLCLVAVMVAHAPDVLVLAVVQFAAMGLASHSQRRGQSAVRLGVILMISITAWQVAVTLLWWQPYRTWVIGSWELLLAFIGAFALVVAVITPREGYLPGPYSRKTDRLLALGAIGAFGWASLDFFPTFAVVSSKAQHWGVYVGAANLVRHGGWPLWDVPIQYGFLSTLSIAAFPANAWEAFYLLQAVVTWFVASWLFLLLRSLRPGAASWCFAFLVSVSTVFLLSGWAPSLYGAQVTPSTGPFRFIWCYILLAILHWQWTHSMTRHVLFWWVGCIAWLFGSLWSAESAAYCAAIWLPAYVLLVLRDAYTERRLTIAAWLALPALLLAASVVTIALIYRVCLGHLPDWRGYVDYALSFSATAFIRTATIPLTGAAGVTFLVLCVLTVLAVTLIRYREYTALPLVIGAWGAVWATTSYYVAEVGPSNVLRLSAMLCATLIIALIVLAHSRLVGLWAIAIRAVIVPVFVVILSMTYGDAPALSVHPISTALAGRFDITTSLPQMDPTLRGLFTTAGVGPDDPIIFYDLDPLPVWTVAVDGIPHLVTDAPAWLPAAPLALIYPLPDARKSVFMDRFVARAHRGGWLVQHAALPYTRENWLAKEIEAHFTPTRQYASGDWQIIWFEYHR